MSTAATTPLNTTRLLIAAVGHIDNPQVLARLLNKVDRRIKSINYQEPSTEQGVKRGDIVRFGSEHGERTRGKVLRINKTTVTLITIDPRGKSSPKPTGSILRWPADQIERLEM